MEKRMKLMEGKVIKDITETEYTKLIESGQKLVLLEKETKEQGCPVYKHLKTFKG